MLNWSEVCIIATAPANFAGAATAATRMLCIFAEAGAEAVFVPFNQPFQIQELTTHGVQLVVPKIRSDAYPTSECITAVAVTQELVRRAMQTVRRGKRVILLGVYLFPFCQCVRSARAILADAGIELECVIVPAGSDVWQVGSKAIDLASSVMIGRQISRVTFSDRFVGEIKRLCGSCGSFSVIPPAVDVERYRPTTLAGKCDLRCQLGIPENQLTLLACSNMRPVKGIRETLAIAAEVARHRQTTLIMVGPITIDLICALGGNSVPSDVPSGCMIQSGPLLIYLAGLQKETIHFHQASDLAVCTSYHDSFNLSLAESLACGTPVVSSDVVGICEIVRRYNCGLLFPFDADPIETGSLSEAGPPARFDVGDVAERVLMMCAHRTSLELMSSRASQAAIECYSNAVVRREWEMLLQH
jgi:glycosyltransferase involved in cell wall biosynthesis